MVPPLYNHLTTPVISVPEETLKLKEARGERATDCKCRLTETKHHSSIIAVNYSELKTEKSGVATLIGRVKSHPDVAERHYPDLFKQFFPNGLPAQATAY